MNQENLVDLAYGINDLMVKIYKSLGTFSISFLSDKEYDDNDDLIWGIPRCSRVTKHGFYIEYCITNIDNGVVTAKGIGDDYGDVITISITELEYGEIISLINHIN